MNLLINITYLKKKKKKKSFIYCSFIYSTYEFKKKKVAHINFIFGVKIVLFFPTQMKHLFHDGNFFIALQVHSFTLALIAFYQRGFNIP